MLIIISNVVHVHTVSDPVLDYLHLDAFPPLQQPIISRQSENMALKHTTNVHLKK